MSSRKKQKKPAVNKKNQSKYKENPRLPGYLLIAFGLLTLPLNFDLIPGLEAGRAWPLFLVLFGVAMVVKAIISKETD